jgi:two-component system, NarL family, sensor histidine kinase UhpB
MRKDDAIPEAMAARCPNRRRSFGSARVREADKIAAPASFEHLMLDAIARERIELAGALHDGLGQELVGIALLAKSLANRRAADADEIRADLAQLASLSSQAVETCRTVAHGLSPLSEAPSGLVEALRRLTIMPRNWPGPSVTFAVLASDPLLLSPEAVTHIYRLAQEGITNAIKHANAQTIKMTLDIRSDLVTLKISDDGIGLRTKNTDTGPHLGIKLMSYRAHLLRGMLRLDQRRNGGTRLVFVCGQGHSSLSVRPHILDSQPTVALPPVESPNRSRIRVID